VIDAGVLVTSIRGSGLVGQGPLWRGASDRAVSVTAESFAEGDHLSNALERALPEVVEVVADLVTGRRRT
jgi:hypothetical protein